MPFRSRFAASLMALALGLAAPAAQAFTLHVLHVNDTHSRIQSVTKTDSTCSGEDEAKGACFGGSARLKTAVDAARRAAGTEPVILLDAGDQFQGSLFFTAYSGQVEAEMMNRIGFDAMALGNHEFDLGDEALTRFADTLQAPLLSGSVDASGDAALAGQLSKPLVLEVGGTRVGIVAATTPETPEISSPGPGVTFGDPAQTVAADIAGLTAEGVDKVIVLSHLGAPADIRLAEAVPGIDLIVGGHTHTLFSNANPDAPFRYPHWVTGPDGARVPVVSAGAYTRYLGHAVVTFDDAGRVTEVRGDTQPLDAAVVPDPEILKRIGELGAPIESLKAERVGSVATDIDGSRESCRTGECAMGNLVADAMLDRVKSQGVTIALQNGGGLRASIGAGEVTKGDVLAVLPFQNTLSTFNLPGSALRAALENGFSQVEEGGGRFPQVAGLRVTWDAAKPAGARVVSVEVAGKGGWQPLDPAMVYTVVSNNFMRSGGDGYASLRDAATNAYDFGPNLEDVLADYLARHPEYAPVSEGRIRLVQ